MKILFFTFRTRKLDDDEDEDDSIVTLCYHESTKRGELYVFLTRRGYNHP